MFWSDGRVGRRRSPAKRVYAVKAYRGFESLSLRHQSECRLGIRFSCVLIKNSVYFQKISAIATVRDLSSDKARSENWRMCEPIASGRETQSGVVKVAPLSALSEGFRPKQGGTAE